LVDLDVGQDLDQGRSDIIIEVSLDPVAGVIHKIACVIKMKMTRPGVKFFVGGGVLDDKKPFPVNGHVGRHIRSFKGSLHEIYIHVLNTGARPCIMFPKTPVR